jgi:hypothetical protein
LGWWHQNRSSSGLPLEGCSGRHPSLWLFVAHLGVGWFVAAGAMRHHAPDVWGHALTHEWHVYVAVVRSPTCRMKCVRTLQMHACLCKGARTQLPCLGCALLIRCAAIGTWQCSTQALRAVRCTVHCNSDIYKTWYPHVHHQQHFSFWQGPVSCLVHQPVKSEVGAMRARLQKMHIRQYSTHCACQLQPSSHRKGP